ncbi:MAG: hypothetical protein JXQ73_20295 [Phycisphaerae bacterium]|nr:hypothetical protein [Phycisphaerae bacterium]
MRAAKASHRSPGATLVGFGFIVLGFGALATSQEDVTYLSYLRFEAAGPVPGCTCSAARLGARTDASDDFDADKDRAVDPNQTGLAFAAVYYEQGPNWSASTGFYDRDIRAEPTEGGTYTWSLYVWNGSDWPNEEIDFILDAVLARDANYVLKLKAVPAGITGAPDVGTTWEVPRSGLLSIPLPSYETTDGKKGYRFTVTMTDGRTPPEPTMTDGRTPPEPTPACASAMPLVMAALGSGIWLLMRRRV